MSNIDILKLCSEQFEFHKEFIGKCIAELEYGTNQEIKDDITQFCNTMRKMLHGDRFYDGSTSVIWAYRDRIKLH